MGCAISKTKQTRCKHCNGPCSPVNRSYSLHAHSQASMEADSYHVVPLSYSTLGSLQLDHCSSSPNPLRHLTSYNDHVLVDEDDKKKAEFEVGMIEAKGWSKMIDEKITKVVPRTPVMTPPGEPETINAWDMMEGLEDASPLRPVASDHRHHLRSFSFHVKPNEMPDLMDDSPPRMKRENGFASPKPMWIETPDKDDGCFSNEKLKPKTIASEFDPEIISAFRKALEELSPTNSFRLSKQQQGPSHVNTEPNGTVDDMKSTIGLPEKKVNGSMEKDNSQRLILYFTSLRGVRKTYEECCNVRMILKGLGVRVDERDVSMHSAFKEELRELLAESYGGGLPRVFVGDKYIGGAEEIRRMHEEGRLEKVLEECELVENGGDGSLGGTCKACGDVRFVPCETCSGSCKVYYEVDEEEDEEHYEEGELGFQRCPDCNENGLIRCLICCC